MKRFILALTIFSVFGGLAYAGVLGKRNETDHAAALSRMVRGQRMERQPVGHLCFHQHGIRPNPDLFDIVQSASEGHPVYGTVDHYVGDDHAWGGGADIKYFFHRYFGIGIEGFALNARRGGFDLESDGDTVFIHDRFTDHRAIGEVLRTFTLRYPVPCTRFAPYVWAGGGAIFGGGEQDKIIFDGFGGIGPARFRSITRCTAIVRPRR